MRIRLPPPSSGHSGSENAAARPIQRLLTKRARMHEALPRTARGPFRVGHGNPDQGFRHMPQYGSDTGRERLHNSTMDGPIRKRRSPNQLGVPETTSKR